MPPTSEETAAAADQQQQQQQQYAYFMQQQQQQQQQQMMMQQTMQHQQMQQTQAASSGANGAPPAPAELSALQYAQLQQLQFQAMQWQYLQHLQQQQQQLAANGQQPAGQFDPTAGGEQQAAGGSKQYRSAYQTYGDYPTPQQQQMMPFNSQQTMQATNSDDTSTAAAGTTSRSARHQHAPSIDPNAWNDSIAFPSKANPDRYISHRNYFSNIPPVINRLPRKPELKELVLKGREFYTNNRDPRFYNPTQEAGWDNRAQVVKTPITGGKPHSAGSGVKFPSPSQTQALAAQAHHMQALPNVEEAKEAFGHFPVLVDNGAASARPGSKLLVPFLHNWPPPFRFDYLKKHSRAPLSPFLASLNGYEVPPELFMSAKQRAEQERAEAQMRAEQGYAGAYPPEFDAGASSHRPSAHSLDPIERARARANTHTTYWRTVPPPSDAEGGGDVSQKSSQRSLSDRHNPQAHGGGKSSRPEWNYRHHLQPPKRPVGQTTAKKPAGRGDRAKQQLAAQQQQQQMFMHPPGQMLPPLMHNGQPVMPPYFFYPNGQPMQFAPFQYDPNLMQQQLAAAGFDPNQMMMMQQQQQFDPNQQHGEHYDQHQYQEEYDQQAEQQHEQAQSHEEEKEEDLQQQQQHQDQQQTDGSSDASANSSDAAPRAHTQLPPPEEPSPPGLNPNAQTHIKDLHAQLYQQPHQPAA